MKGAVVWFTGLPSSGKTSLAERVCRSLEVACISCVLLDGDDVRGALRPRPGYDDQARRDFYSTLANLAALIARQGVIALVSATAHRRAYRDEARALAPRFVEVHVSTPPEICAHRDTKGLYAAARLGKVAHMPGVDAQYEAPLSPDVVASGRDDDEALARIVVLASRA